MEVCGPRRRVSAWSLAALMALAGAVALVPTVQAGHFAQSCGGLAPVGVSCTLTVPTAHLPGISVSFATFGPPAYTGQFRVTIDDGVGPPDVVWCGPYVSGFAFGGCTGSAGFVPGRSVDVTTEARSLADTGPGAGAWQVTVSN